MNKRKNLWYLGLLMLLFLAALFVRFMVVENPSSEALKTNSKSIIQTEDVAAAEPQKTLLAKQKSLPQYTDNEIQAVLAVLQPHGFHHDPYVEAKILIELNRRCQFNNEVSADCTGISARFKKLEGLINPYQDLQFIPTNTELGQAIKTQIPYDPSYPEVYRQNQRDVLKAVIMSKNPHVMSLHAMNFVYRSVGYGEILPFSRWLNSQDGDYNDSVVMFALFNLANQHGADGFAIFSFCTVNKSLCGVGFEEGYNLLVMPGMQKDVEIMIMNLKQFVESNQY